jgi:hypothetical protein
MFGLLDGFKYRSEVMVQIHAILKFVPELGQLLKTFPTVKLAINQLRKEKMPAAEAASSSLLVIERAVANIPRETRALTLQQLKDSADNEFRFFSEIAGALSEGKTSAYPEGMPILTMALGFSLWYLGYLLREGQISQQACNTYMGDVAGMLLGKSDEDRLKHRLHLAMSPPPGTGGSIDDRHTR